MPQITMKQAVAAARAAIADMHDDVSPLDELATGILPDMREAAGLL